MKLTAKDIEALDRAIKHAKPKEVITLLFWSIFKRNRARKFLKCINTGLTWKASFLIAKNI